MNKSGVKMITEKNHSKNRNFLVSKISHMYFSAYQISGYHAGGEAQLMPRLLGSLGYLGTTLS